MTTEEVAIEGRYFDGKIPVAHSAVLTINDNEAILVSGDIERTFRRDKLLVSPRIGTADRFVRLAGAGQYHCTDHPVLNKLPQEVRSEGLVAWLEKNIAVAIASIAIVVSVVLVGYFYGLPALADKLVNRIPMTTEASFGEGVLEWFDKNGLFRPSEIAPEKQQELSNEFAKLHASLEVSPFLKLEFRNSEPVGPNAFALPGGTVVITDQMIDFAGSNEEILAILAHEAGHVERRHSMRQVLQGSLIALVVATVTADAATVGSTLSGLPALFLQAKYSRDLETEADDFAFDLLTKNNISPAAFASVMEKLDQETEGMQELSFISTHPITSERISKAREAGRANR